MNTLIDNYRTYLVQTGSEVAAAILAIGASGSPNIPTLSAPELPVDGPYTVGQVAKQLRTSPDTVRGWVKSNQLRAANLATGTRPRYMVTRDDLGAFLKRRQPEPPAQRRGRKIVTQSQRY